MAGPEKHRRGSTRAELNTHQKISDRMIRAQHQEGGVTKTATNNDIRGTK